MVSNKQIVISVLFFILGLVDALEIRYKYVSLVASPCWIVPLVSQGNNFVYLRFPRLAETSGWINLQKLGLVHRGSPWTGSTKGFANVQVLHLVSRCILRAEVVADTPQVGLFRRGVGIFGFDHFLGRFFGFCTEKLRFSLLLSVWSPVLPFV